MRRISESRRWTVRDTAPPNHGGWVRACGLNQGGGVPLPGSGVSGSSANRGCPSRSCGVDSLLLASRPGRACPRGRPCYRRRRCRPSLWTGRSWYPATCPANQRPRPDPPKRIGIEVVRPAQRPTSLLRSRSRHASVGALGVRHGAGPSIGRSRRAGRRFRHTQAFFKAALPNAARGIPGQ